MYKEGNTNVEEMMMKLGISKEDIKFIQEEDIEDEVVIDEEITDER